MSRSPADEVAADWGWEEFIPLDVKQGDLIWMECLPGGICIFLNKHPHSKQRDNLRANCEFSVYHAVGGRMRIPDYYFISLDEAHRLGYTVKTDEEESPNDWETTPYGEQK